jgi:hypothetical protein
MQFVKFGDEYVAAARIVRVVFETDKQAQPSESDPYMHKPQPSAKDVAVALVTVEGRDSDLRVSGDAALKALLDFCGRDGVLIF